MINKIKNTDFAAKKPEKQADNNDIGYPLYPPSEDIYNQFKEEINIDPENVLEMKAKNSDEAVQPRNEEDLLRDDLDVPNAETDDAEEAIGSEDEENNYYSIGGDNHDNLEENQDELEQKN
jgi:hypothetical protein